MEFTDREFQIIHDSEFLLTKAGATSKVQELLSEVKVALKDVVKKSGIDPDQIKLFSSEKISKGENYRGLPYQVLDYPATFLKHDIFAFRTMFWWGNYFSCTLHLQGTMLDKYRRQIISNIGQLLNHDVHLCVNESPWEYHFEPDNYRILSLDDQEFIQRCSFLKLSKPIELDSWKHLPNVAGQYLMLLLDALYSEQ